MIEEKYIWAYALKNAVEHGGKAVIGSVISGLFNCGLEKGDIKKEMFEINNVLKNVNSMSLNEQKKKFEAYGDLIGHRPEREGLPELEGVRKGKIITRFAPSPSGALTLGHILTIGPNYLYSQKYNGKFYLRIEDTNPDNIYSPAYKMIEKEAKWLCDNNLEVFIQSNRMKIYYKYAEKLLNEGNAYVCECSSEKFKKLADGKKPCPCRNLDIKENKIRWKKMFDKSGYKEGEAVLRFKTPEKFLGINHKNPAMRDFPLARINLTKHPLQANKYRVWPLMNLAVPVDDIEMKITHMIRGKDHKDNAERQKMIFEVLGKKYPWTGYIGRVHFTDFVMSSSQMRKDIESGKYSGWDDPRIPSVSSLKKRGYTPEAFWRFVEQRGISEADKIINSSDFFQLLDKFNKMV